MKSRIVWLIAVNVFLTTVKDVYKRQFENKVSRRDCKELCTGSGCQCPHYHLEHWSPSYHYFFFTEGSIHVHFILFRGQILLEIPFYIHHTSWVLIKITAKTCTMWDLTKLNKTVSLQSGISVETTLLVTEYSRNLQSSWRHNNKWTLEIGNRHISHLEVYSTGL